MRRALRFLDWLRLVDWLQLVGWPLFTVAVLVVSVVSGRLFVAGVAGICLAVQLYHLARVVRGAWRLYRLRRDMGEFLQELRR